MPCAIPLRTRLFLVRYFQEGGGLAPARQALRAVWTPACVCECGAEHRHQFVLVPQAPPRYESGSSAEDGHLMLRGPTAAGILRAPDVPGS